MNPQVQKQYLSSFQTTAGQMISNRSQSSKRTPQEKSMGSDSQRQQQSQSPTQSGMLNYSSGQLFSYRPTEQSFKALEQYKHESLAKQLKRKHQISYQKYKSQKGRLDSAVVAFFYLQNSVQAANGTYYNHIYRLQQRMRGFAAKTMKFNQPTELIHFKPSLIIVANDIFSQNDKTLQNKVQQSVPNTFKSSNLLPSGNNINFRSINSTSQLQVRQNIDAHLADSGMRRMLGTAQKKEDNLMNLVQRQERERQKEQYQQTMNVVQSHIFDNKYEPSELSVFDYLMKISHDILSFRHFEMLLEYWGSQKVDWHIERGLELNADGTAPNGTKGISYIDYKYMANPLRQALVREAKMGVFCISKMKPGDIPCHSVRPSENDKYHHECHYFCQNAPELQKQLRLSLGSQVYVGKYDFHHTNMRAPLGTSIFQLAKEREYADQHYKQLNDKHKENQRKLDKKMTPEEKDPKIIPEPQPGPNHQHCAICFQNFSDYLQHVSSSLHLSAIHNSYNQKFTAEIDQQIRELQQQSQSFLNPEEKSTSNVCQEENSSGGSIRSKSTTCSSQNQAMAPPKKNLVQEFGNIISIDLEQSEEVEKFCGMKRKKPSVEIDTKVLISKDRKRDKKATDKKLSQDREIEEEEEQLVFLDQVKRRA